jgi:hypothetical protein
MIELLSRFGAVTHTRDGLRTLFIVCGGLAVFVHIAFLVPAFYALARFTSEFAKHTNLNVDRFSTHIVWMPAILLLSIILVVQPWPMDDLLSIAAIGSGVFTHSSFVYAEWQKLGISPWYGLEQIVGYLSRAAGQDVAIRLTQLASVLFTVTSITLAAKKLAGDRKDLALHTALILALILASGIIQRAIGGRAETFFVAWGIAAIWMPARYWLPLGVLMTPLYWLSWIYAPMALLLQASLRVRLLAMFIYGATALLSWIYLNGAHYPEMFSLTAEWVSMRKVEMSENIPALSSILLSPASLFLSSLLLIGGLMGIGKLKEDWPFAIVCLWFLIPDMARYTPGIMAISGLWLIAAMARGMPSQPIRAALVPIIVAMCLLLAKTIPGSSEETHPHFKVPEGAILMGSVSSALQETIRRNPGIRVTPSFEVGATNPEIQTALLDLILHGQFDCDLLKKFPVDYLIENSLKSIPACLEINQVSGGWRLWKIKGA